MLQGFIKESFGEEAMAGLGNIAKTQPPVFHMSHSTQRKAPQMELELFSVDELLQKTVSNFGGNNSAHKISIDNKQNSSQVKINVIPERFAFMIHNLVKNSLNYSDANIQIGFENRNYENKDYLSIYVYNADQQINSSDNSDQIDQHDQDPVEESGFGLEFCKRNMEIFGGNIICEAEQGGSKKFSLLFPVVQEQKKPDQQENTKRILIIDDEKLNLLTAKARIEKNLKGISCVIEQDSAKALSLIKKGNHGFDLILSDLEMPKLNGHEFSEQIRKHNKEIPIIIYSSRLHRDSLGELNYANASFSQYLRKDVKNPILYRSISKWLNLKDPMDYLGDEVEYSRILNGKVVLIVNDGKHNRKALKRRIESHGAKVIEVSGGNQMVKAYINSVNNKNHIDAIISDIKMPDLNGDEAAKEIRKIELENKVYHSQRIPIIAIINKDSSREEIDRYLDCKMTDYYTKGSNPELAIKLIANYLNIL